MQCPRCRGYDTEPIGPAEATGTQTYRCTSEQMQMIPTGAHPGGGNALKPQYYVCGHRFVGPESSPMLTQKGDTLCACGLFASGACRWCSKPVCERHLTTPQDRVTCEACASPEAVTARAEAEAQAIIEAEAREHARARAKAQARAAREKEGHDLRADLNECWRLLEKLLRVRPPFNAETAHLHFVQEGHLMKEGRNAFGSKLEWDGKMKSRRVTDFSDALATVSGIRNGSPCPLHGESCKATIERRKMKVWSVTFRATGWSVGSHMRSHSDTGRGGSNYEYTAPNVLTPDGAVIEETTRGAACLTEGNFARVLRLESRPAVEALSRTVRTMLGQR